MKKQMECWGVNGCQEPVAWVRCTQFSGDHPFCDGCARKQADFGQDKSGQFYWVTLEDY